MNYVGWNNAAQLHEERHRKPHACNAVAIAICANIYGNNSASLSIFTHLPVERLAVLHSLVAAVRHSRAVAELHNLAAVAAHRTPELPVEGHLDTVRKVVRIFDGEERLLVGIVRSGV